MRGECVCVQSSIVFSYAHLVFADEATAEKALPLLNGKQVGANKITVDYCGKKAKNPGGKSEWIFEIQLIFICSAIGDRRVAGHDGELAGAARRRHSAQLDRRQGARAVPSGDRSVLTL